MTDTPHRPIRPFIVKLSLGATTVIAAHCAILLDGVAAAAALIYLYIALMAGLFALRAEGRGRWCLALLVAGCVLVIALTIMARSLDGTLMLVAPPMFGYLLVSLYFAESLLVGRTPAVVRMARIVHGVPLPAAVARHALTLTWIWAILPAGLALVSLFLLLVYGLEGWSWAANVVNPSIMLAVFLGDIPYRYWKFPELGRPSLNDTFRAMIEAHVR